MPRKQKELSPKKKTKEKSPMVDGTLSRSSPAPRHK
jgi:hypothetical protein